MPSRRSSRRRSLRARRRNGRGSSVDSPDAPDAAVGAVGGAAASPTGRCPPLWLLSMDLGSLAGISLSSSGAVGGSTGGTAAVVADGRPLSAAADVSGGDALLLSLLCARPAIHSSVLVCRLYGQHYFRHCASRAQKKGASELLLKLCNTYYRRSPT